MISILSKAATWFREQPFGEAFSCVFSSPPCSAQLIWTAVMSAMDQKINDYLEMGVRHVWFLDPIAGNVFDATTVRLKVE